MRIVGIDVPGFGVPTHAEAKDVLAGAMLAYASEEIKAGPVARPTQSDTQQARPTVALVGEMFPVDKAISNVFNKKELEKIIDPSNYLGAGPAMAQRLLNNR